MWSEEDDAGADDGAGDDILVLGDEGEAALGAGEGVLEEEEEGATAEVELTFEVELVKEDSVDRRVLDVVVVDAVTVVILFLFFGWTG